MELMTLPVTSMAIVEHWAAKKIKIIRLLKSNRLMLSAFFCARIKASAAEEWGWCLLEVENDNKQQLQTLIFDYLFDIIWIPLPKRKILLLNFWIFSHFHKEIIIRGPQIDIQMQCYITSSAKVNYLTSLFWLWHIL